ncbi:RNA polymerase subunit sigma-70 [Vibrio cholerae]|nr:RNA polymerase subunit sigma-70 [Vibrio cholerae]
MATDIPFLLEAAAVLATFVHPNHIVYLCSWGLTHSLSDYLQLQVVWV